MTIRDNRFGRFKFGTSHKFGASSFPEMSLAWDVSVDWNGDHLYEENEAQRVTSVYISRGRNRLLATSGSGLQMPSTGTATITLSNEDGRFDGWNQDSPLYPNVGYKKEVRIRVRPLDGSVVYPLFMGRIVNIVPSGEGERKSVTLYVNDGMDFLRNAAARVAMQYDITPGEAIGKVLDSAGWKHWWGRDLDTSVETIDYWWASGNTRALDAIEDLETSFLGYFFVNARGQARYLDRSTVGDLVAEFHQVRLLKDIGNPQPYEVQRDVTRLKVHPRTLAATGVIWQLVGNIPSIEDGSANALKLFANYTYDGQAVPARNVVDPVATTDFTVNSQSDGGGTDLTSSCTVSMTDFGDTALLTVTNTSGTLGYITKLQIRGDAVYEVNAADVTYPKNLDDAESLRELEIDLLWQQDVNVAVDLAQVIGPFYAGLHPMPMIQLENRFDEQFLPDLFDIVACDLPKLGLTGQVFRVGGIEHKTVDSDNCQRVQTRLWLEPYIAAGEYMQWDSNSVWNTSTVFGW